MGLSPACTDLTWCCCRGAPRQVGYDALDEDARGLLEELRERQAMIVDGSFDLEKSFDDFRLVVGEGTL